MRALGVVDDGELEPLREAAARGLDAYAQAFLAAVSANPMLAKYLPYVLYETLGPTLPDGLAGAAALWGLAQKTAMTYPDAVRRAGHADGNALFEAILSSPLRRDVHRARIRRRLRADQPRRSQDRPEHARDARRDPCAARRDDRTHHCRSSRSCCRRASGAPTPPTTSSAIPAGASATPTGRCGSASRTPRSLGLVDGGRARITTAAGSAEATVEVSEAMLPGHASLPNGFGLDYIDADGAVRRAGRRPERAHVVRLARRLRRHAVAQARPGADRGGGAHLGCEP